MSPYAIVWSVVVYIYIYFRLGHLTIDSGFYSNLDIYIRAHQADWQRTLHLYLYER